MKKVAVFFGKGGSNFINLLKHQKNYEVILGITNRKDSKALNFPKLPEILISSSNEEILDKLIRINPDLIILAGYMKIIPPEIINAFENKIINLHPSILPEFKGLNADKRSFEAKNGCGITIHYANKELDSGKIILQYHINPHFFKNFEEYHKTLKKAEHQFLPLVVNNLCGII